MASFVGPETVSLVIDHLWPILKKEVKLQLKSKEEAGKLRSNLNKIKQLLDIAEKTRPTNPEAKRCFEILQDVAYDIEDALDEWEILDANHLHHVHRVRVRSLYPRFKKFFTHRRVAGVLNDLNEIVDRVYDKARDELKFVSSHDHHRFKKDASVSTIIEAEFPGRGSDKETIKKMITNSPTNQNDRDRTIPFHVVAIHGGGGLGKTTLAQLVFNDIEVQKEFQASIWVCVSDTFDEVLIAEQILQHLDQRKPDVSGLAALAQGIKRSISNKKFLIVLDDVWVEDHTKWKSMKGYLSSGAPGSVILVTTRKERAATSILGLTKPQIHWLQPLEDEACWSIIRQIVFQGKDDTRFEDVGKAIARKCKGSPLAAHVLGGHLRHKTTALEWERVLKSKTWEDQNVGNDLFPHFFLSYNELEPPVRHCFSYCTVFPKDTEIDVENLIRVWIAQGFLLSTTFEEMEMEGRAYFEDLAQRSFFQNLRHDFAMDYQIVRCKMHDIVHDFAQYLSENKCHIVDDVNTHGDGSYKTSIRHLFVPSTVKCDDVPVPNLKLRSLFCYGELTMSLLDRMKSVRSLTLDWYWVDLLPEAIGNLIHLRYLCLITGYWGVKVPVPEAICNLYYLQTLHLQGNSYSGLPQGISKLTKLRYIFLDPKISSGFLFPQGLERLTNLRGLNFFYAGTGLNKLECLQNLNQLTGKLNLVLDGLNSTEDVEDA